MLDGFVFQQCITCVMHSIAYYVAERLFYSLFISFYTLLNILHDFTSSPMPYSTFSPRMAILDSSFFSSQQIQSKTVAQCVEYYYSWKKGQKLAHTLAQVSGKKIKIRQEGHETGRRGENLLVSLARHCSARITLSHTLGKAQQMLPRASLCCCSEMGNSGAEL